MIFRKFMLFSFLALVAMTHQGIAQDKAPARYGKITPADFDLSKQKFDSGAAAVVIADIGNSEFVSTLFSATRLTLSVFFLSTVVAFTICVVLILLRTVMLILEEMSARASRFATASVSPQPCPVTSAAKELDWDSNTSKAMDRLASFKMPPESVE